MAKGTGMLLDGVDPRSSAGWQALATLSAAAAAAAEDAEAEAAQTSLLHALLESLPEPPVTAIKKTPRLDASTTTTTSALATLNALADSLPAPPATVFASARPLLSPPHSPLQPLQFTLSNSQFDTSATTAEDGMSYPVQMPRQLPRALRPVSGAAFGYTTTNDYDHGYSSEEDLAAVRPPSALFYPDPVAMVVGGLPPSAAAAAALETPAPSRRNTEDDDAIAAGLLLLPPLSWGCHRERLRRLPSLEPLLLPHAMPVASQESFLVGRALAARGDITPPPLGAEMPPVSPFFARIRPSDIEDVRETVRRASITRRRRNTLAVAADQRSTWCASVSEQPFASLRQLTATATPTRASLAGTLPGWQPSSIGRWSSFNPMPDRQTRRPDSLSSIGSSEDWLINQEPPISPLFADENRLAVELRKSVPAAADSLFASSACAPAPCHGVPPQRSARWYQVSVHSLFSSPFDSPSTRPRVSVTELNGSSRPADTNDPEVQRALRRYPLALALATRQQKQSVAMPTRMRVPSQRRSSPASAVPLLLSTPTLSFTVSSGADSGADRSVRAVDVEAMAAAYLPHIHALLAGSDAFDPMMPAQAAPYASGSLRTPSESSTATLTDSLRSDAPAEQQSKPAARAPLRRLPRRSDIGPATVVSLKPDAPSMAFPAPRQQLRASASVMNLRGAYAERAGSLPLPPTPLSAGARRSTLATRAVPQPPLTPAAPATNRHSIVRRNSAMELNGSRTQPQPLRRMQHQHTLPLPASYALAEAPLKLRPSNSYQPSAANMGPAETPTVQRSSTSTGLRTPTSLNNLSYRSQFQAGSTRGRLQTSGEAMPALLTPMRSASLEISPTTNGSVYSASSGSTCRAPRITGMIQTPHSLRKPPACPSTVSIFGRRRGTSTVATATLGSAVTPTTPRTLATASRILKLAKPLQPIPAAASVGLLANGPRSAPMPAFMPESYSSLPPLPKRTPVGHHRRPDVRNMFGYVDDCQPLPKLPPRLPTPASATGNLADMYRGPSSALPLFRVNSKRSADM